MKLPTNLAYERSIDPSDVCFFVVWPDNKKTPLTYTSRTLLGQMETASLAYDSSGNPKESATAEALAQGNPHQVDFCHVPFGASHVECCFSVSFCSELRKPYKCNSSGIKQTLVQLVELYETKIGWTELATRYLMNICNGKWLWKNTRKAYCWNIALTPWPWNGEQVEFEDIRTNYTSRQDFENNKNWSSIVEMIKTAFSSTNGLAIFEVRATLHLPTNAMVRPSQVFIEKESGSKSKSKTQNSRVFQSTTIDGERSPILGAFKTGAAIATIDDWYPDATEPLRVGRFGVHHEDVICYRHPSTGKDFFSILQQAEHYIEVLSANKAAGQDTINDMHFLMANLIKGGMFQHKGD
ncbi:type I-F CRISPR-associated protein Csy3 [Vibrio cholerae]|nr:type I-F CRISPR-associated protein Csy3 [Vibrio cholerae]EJK2101612.1 type I-F CRISPR-associated protein Csy3 [Vibrio cholerae]EJL6647164.1 type I-F CRISPR-associated protein Csy3 [Vibrio cholerae]EJL6950849.1 type I-F CRISPR-associated protein Csy3 [Vibrio cholerae]EKF9424736.1 type I-F CRISPR-associated protein Csy3 [Vibrio cholerae]